MKYYLSADVGIFLLETGSELDENEEEIELKANPFGGNICPSPTLLPANLAPTVAADLQRADSDDDRALRGIVSPDFLNFDWRKEPETFRGVRHVFTGTPGPTIPISDIDSPLKAFLKIWDPHIIDLIVRETNRYAQQILDQIKGCLKTNSRCKTWTPTDANEMMIFFAVLMFHSLSPKPLEQDYFKTTGTLAMPGLASLMPYNRFLQLKRFLHFADLTHEPADMTLQQRRLYNIQPIVDSLRRKFSSLYMPSQSITIDERLLVWSGRLSFAQKISNKASKVGIKSFELYESSTGYLWQFFICAGKQAANRQADSQTNTMVQTDQQMDYTGAPSQSMTDQTGNVEPDGATAKALYDLARPLLGKGHTLVMDNCYNSPLLARCLRAKKTDVLGTLRVSREFVPKSLKSFAKSELRPGEIVYSHTHDLLVFLWRDENLICVISTYHPMEVDAIEKYGDRRFKPQAVLDYNSLMGGVDKKEQLLSVYPIERIRNQVWFQKIFRRLLNVSILNSHILFRCRESNITQRAFRKNLAEALITVFRPPQPPRKEVKTLSVAENRPRLAGNHFIVRGKSKYTVCVWCRSIKTRTRTIYRCEQCNVALCLEICFKNYHTV